MEPGSMEHGSGPGEKQPGAMELGAEAERNEWARRELAELGLETTTENIQAVLAQAETPQIPAGYDELTKFLGEIDFESPTEQQLGALQTQMEADGIRSITHVEGTNVWQHVQEIMRQIDKLDVTDERRRELRLIMLYHDLGKAEVWNDEKNSTITTKKLKKGDLHQSMIGHAKASWPAMEAGLQSNGVDDESRARMMKVIEFHMESLDAMKPKTLVGRIEELGATDEERRAVLDLLVQVLYVDGQATRKVMIKDGNIEVSANEKKVRLDADELWDKYQAEKTRQAEEAAVQAEAKARDEKIAAALGASSLGAYLKEVGLQGRQIGQVMGSLKRRMAEIAEMPPEEIKSTVDQVVKGVLE